MTRGNDRNDPFQTPVSDPEDPGSRQPQGPPEIRGLLARSATTSILGLDEGHEARYFRSMLKRRPQPLLACRISLNGSLMSLLSLNYPTFRSLLALLSVSAPHVRKENRVP